MHKPHNNAFYKYFDDYPYTKYEKARIIGARAEQIAHGSPIFVDPGGIIDPIEIAKIEFEKGVCPITVEKERKIKQTKENLLKIKKVM